MPGRAHGPRGRLRSALPVFGWGSVALDPAYVTLLGAAGHVPAPNRLAHERQKLLGPATLPENLWHWPQLPPPATLPYMNPPTQFRIRRRQQKLYGVCPYNKKLGSLPDTNQFEKEIDFYD